MTGRFTDLYELGKALEHTCERVEYFEPFEDANAKLEEQVAELEAAVAEMKAMTKTFALDCVRGLACGSG